MKIEELTESFTYDRRATVRGFDDYHDIDAYADHLSEEVGRKVRGTELGFVEGMPNHEGYIGLFYVGRRPAKRVVYSMLRKLFKKHIDPNFDIEKAVKCVAGGGSIYAEKSREQFSTDYSIEWVCEK